MRALWEWERDATINTVAAQILSSFVHLPDLKPSAVTGFCETAAFWMRGFLTARYRAAHPRSSEYEPEPSRAAWDELEARAAKGDVTAFEAMAKHGRDLIPVATAGYRAARAARDGLLARKTQLERSIERWRFAAVALQILGLIVVLAKDLVGDSAR
jgi:hypothetical protein